ncbi:hypothetical protein EGW08_018109 [Elysia chlorotica]|uniref:Uncharacterized protein n=1 Tax=Elysia chlorotica TaxID=188477 RepID=A0A3S0ZG77_ELYCH|nr:hypothetical protein EGW08_018109 [Elysia chlorotica]
MLQSRCQRPAELAMGKETLKLQQSGSTERVVPVDSSLAPVVMDIDRWKMILVSLGFEIEQPDGFHSLEHVAVLTGPGVMPAALEGMIHLLSLINSLSWSILRMILTLMHDEAVALCSLSETIGPNLQDQVTARAFLSRYPEEMAQMGLSKQHHVVVKTIGDRSQIELNVTITLILRTMFEDGPPDIATQAIRCVVASFCYLGDMLSAAGGCDLATTTRVKTAWKKFKELLPVLLSRHLSYKTRGHVYSTCVRSAMLHASETWPLTKPNLQRLQRNDRAMIRQICNVKPEDVATTRSNELLTLLGLEDLNLILKERRLR